MAAILELLRGTGAPVLAAGDEGYLDSIKIFNSAIDTKPLAVLQCTSPEHVIAGLSIAGQCGVPVSVKGGGHNSAGLALRGGGLLLDCSQWKEVDVDPLSRRARCAPGATWGDFDAATQRHGLATPGGVVSKTGVAGLTLGGGIGALRGKHGLTCDNLRSAELVLADGSRVTADLDRNPDLFWALRGGGSNFALSSPSISKFTPSTGSSPAS